MEQQIIKYLSVGLTQQEISEQLKKDGFTPSGLSSIEKAINQLKKKHLAKTMFHLAIILSEKRSN